MSDDEDRRSLSEDEDGEIEDGAAVDAIGGEEGGADGASVDGELERDRLEMLARLDAKASMVELMMQRAEELDEGVGGGQELSFGQVVQVVVVEHEVLGDDDVGGEGGLGP